jgi:hypothetical protein
MGGDNLRELIVGSAVAPGLEQSVDPLHGVGEGSHLPASELIVRREIDLPPLDRPRQNHTTDAGGTAG